MFPQANETSSSSIISVRPVAHKTALNSSHKTALNSSHKTALNSSHKTALNLSHKTTLNSSHKTTLISSHKTALNPSYKTAVYSVANYFVLGPLTAVYQKLELCHKIALKSVIKLLSHKTAQSQNYLITTVHLSHKSVHMISHKTASQTLSQNCASQSQNCFEHPLTCIPLKGLDHQKA